LEIVEMAKSKIPSSEPDGNRSGQTPGTSFDFGANAAPTNDMPLASASTNHTVAGDGPPPSAAPNPFDPASLRLSQDFAANLGVREILVSIPVDKPRGEWFCRVHPSDVYSLPTYVVELKADREVYLVDRTLWPALAGEPTFSPRAIYTAINRQGLLFLWPCRLPGSDGKSPDWITLPLEAVRQAKVGWTRFFWDAGQSRHRIVQAQADLGEPQWPDVSFSNLLKLGFKDRFINTLDHPVLRKLRGEA
jgi:hypothetical protein